MLTDQGVAIVGLSMIGILTTGTILYLVAVIIGDESN